MDHDNRERWLNRVAVGMAPLFEALNAPLPSRVCPGEGHGAMRHDPLDANEDTGDNQD